MPQNTLFFFDTETGGLEPARHAIVQIAWIIEVNGIVQNEMAFDICPEHDQDLNFSALAVNNFTFDRLKAGRNLSYVLCSLKQNLLAARQGSSLTLPVGHNVRFDIDFLIHAAKRCNENLFNDLNFSRALDTCAMLRLLCYQGKLDLSSCKLTTACEHFKIPIQAHDALGDVRATRQLFHVLEGML